MSSRVIAAMDVEPGGLCLHEPEGGERELLMRVVLGAGGRANFVNVFTGEMRSVDAFVNVETEDPPLRAAEAFVAHARAVQAAGSTPTPPALESFERWYLSGKPTIFIHSKYAKEILEYIGVLERACGIQQRKAGAHV